MANTTTGNQGSVSAAEDNNSVITEEDPLKKALHEADNVFNSGTSNNNNDHFLVPGIDSFLGHGYDIFGAFASAKAVKAKIYNLANEEMTIQPTIDQSMSLTPEQISHMFVLPPTEIQLLYKRPKHVGYTGFFEADLSVQEIQFTTGHNNSWGIAAGADGHFMGFKAEVEGSFDTKIACLSSTKCIQMVAKMVYWKLDLSNYTYTNPPPIDDDVKSDFRNESVDSLINKYGTHCLEEVGIGTKIVHSYTIDTSKFSKEIDARAEVKARYDGGEGGGGGGHVSTHLNDKAWMDKSAVSVNIHAYGINDIQVGNITDLSKGLGEYPLRVLAQGWHNPTLISLFEVKDSLKPLWKIKGLMDSNKAALFESEYQRRAATEQSSLAGIFMSLKPLYLFSKKVDGHKRYRLEPQAYYKDDTDEWTLENNGKPWFYISAKPESNLVELHELALNDDLSIVRYETDAYIDTLIKVVDDFRLDGYCWRKTGRRLGFVYPPPTNDTKEVPNVHPVFMFCDKGFQPSRGVFYSKSPNLVLDNGMWALSSDALLALSSPYGYARRLKDVQDWWERQDDWYKFWNGKPTSVGEVGHGYSGDHILTLAESSAPHWFAFSMPEDFSG
jgi:hypothetical protein